MDRRGKVLAGIAATGAAAALFVFDPAASTFYPRCYFHAWTGLYCPGCGATRAIHQLMHGHVAAAAHLNLLFVLGLPFVAAWCLRYGIRRVRGEPARIEIPSRWHPGLMTVAVVFGVVRNIPGFEWLAP